MVPNLRIFIFALNLATRQIQGRCFQISQYFLFQIPAQKYPNKAFLFFHEILQLDKFHDTDFKYYKIIFKSQPKNEQTRIFGTKFKE